MDLHGITHSDAEDLVDSFIARYFDKLPIEIVTGNSIDMQKIVERIVISYELKMEPANYVNLGSYVISHE